MACPTPADWQQMPCPEAVFCIDSTSDAVRHALRDIMSHPLLAGLSDSLRGNAELVLAEVLNNIVEHAYRDMGGKMTLHIAQHVDGPFFQVFDRGRPIPNGKMPQGLLPKLEIGRALPEGGFGWLLIRTLTQELLYRRDGSRNCLSFKLNIGQ